MSDSASPSTWTGDDWCPPSAIASPESRTILRITYGCVRAQWRHEPKSARRLEDAGNPDLVCNPNGHGVSGFRQRHAEGDHALELTIVVGDPFHILVVAIGDADGFVGHHRIEIECCLLKSGEVDNGFHGGP